MRFHRCLAILLIAVLTGCLDLPPITSTPTPEASTEPTATTTATAVPTATKETPPILETLLAETPAPPTEIPPTSVLPTPSATPARVLVHADQLLENGGFEGSWRAVEYNEVNVFFRWQPYYFDDPYTTETCNVVPLEWNPPWEPTCFKRPEFKPANPFADDPGVPNPYPNRVASGDNAQVFFAFSGIMDGGVYQVIDTVPGEFYTISADMQLWSGETVFGGCRGRNAEGDCIDWDSTAATSDQASDDDRRAIWAYLAVDPYGGLNAYRTQTVQRSEPFGFYWQDGLPDDIDYGYGLYDSFERIHMVFRAESRRATIFFGCGNRFAKTHNDCYLDNAVVSGPVEVQP